MCLIRCVVEVYLQKARTAITIVRELQQSVSNYCIGMYAIEVTNPKTISDPHGVKVILVTLLFQFSVCLNPLTDTPYCKNT